MNAQAKAGICDNTPSGLIMRYLLLYTNCVWADILANLPYKSFSFLLIIDSFVFALLFGLQSNHSNKTYQYSENLQKWNWKFIETLINVEEFSKTINWGYMLLWVLLLIWSFIWSKS